jgi:peptidoglycan/LPS O-acetylase OafA/YrhL
LFAARNRLQGKAGALIQLAAACLVAVTYLRGIIGHEVFGFSLVAAGTAVLLAGSGSRATPAWLRRNRLLAGVRWLGRHSYELYLFHIIVLGLMRSFIPRGTMAYGYKLPLLALFLAISAIVAGLVARFYSEPVNAWLRAAFLRAPLPPAAVRP